MASFVQLVEFETDDIEACKETLEKFLGEHPDVITSSSSTWTEDRERRGTYVSIIEFPSYEKAMEQSNSAEMTEMTQRLGRLIKGPARFRNLDVISVMKL